MPRNSTVTTHAAMALRAAEQTSRMATHLRMDPHSRTAETRHRDHPPTRISNLHRSRSAAERYAGSVEKA